MRFTGSGDDCPKNRHGVYTTVGQGIGTPQAGVSAGVTIGWYTDGISTPASFAGPFTEDNITVGPLSGTGWLGGGWLGITFGGAAGWPSIGSLSRQTVDYQLQNP